MKKGPYKKRQFCKYGHDILVVGRYENGRCKQCANESRRMNPALDSRIKQICINGHDTFVVGRVAGGQCKECCRERARLWRIDNPEKAKIATNKNSWKTQGILNLGGDFFTMVDYDRLYQIQQGKCPICNKHQSELDKSLVVDHDHETHTVRGLLCDFCNRNILSIIENFPEFIEQAQQYLYDKKQRKEKSTPSL